MKKISLKNLKETLTRAEMKAINGGSGDGGEKCETISRTDEIYGPYNGGVYAAHTCTIRCRPSFLGIGFGSWTTETIPC